MSLVQRWLREASQPYLHANLVYNDVDSALASHPTVRPKTDVYTYDDGRAELLLCIHGLLPISFRGASYNIPISVWLPQEYPKAVPIVYVVPTGDMLVRASKSVDPSGRCNFPYLENWERKSETCSLRELLDIMQEHFSREPPLYAKPRQTTAKATIQTTNSTSTPSSLSSSPPPPPRPGPRYVEDSPPQSRRAETSFGSPSYRPPPPLPTQALNPSPVPPRALSPTQYQQQHMSTPGQPPSRPMSVISPAQTGQPWTPGHVSHQSLPTFSPPPPPPLQGPFQPQPQPAPQWYSGTGGTASPQQHVQTSYQHSAPVAMSPPPPPPPQLLSQAAAPIQAPQPPAPAPAPIPIRNLMDEEDVPQEVPKYHPTQPPPVVTAAPPRPMNPQLVALHAQLHQKFTKELTTLTTSITREAEGPRAAQNDLLAGEPTIKDEMARLESVRNVCRTVASRLGATASAAELAVAELKRKGDPEVDEIVCATSIVHNQLINLIAEDHAIEDTIYHLHRALNEGRLDLDKFLKTTTRLAEEQFLKRVLIEKITSQLPMGMRMI